MNLQPCPEIGDVEGWNKWLKDYARKKKYQKYDSNHKNVRNSKQNARRATKREAKLSSTEKPFVGVDGEGAGSGMDHIYWLLRVGDRTLYDTDGKCLRTLDILKWLADLGDEDLNDRCIPVGYFFGYDTSMILRYLPEKNLKELFNEAEGCLKPYCKHPKTAHWKGYGTCIHKHCNCKKFQYPGYTTLFLDHDRPDREKKNCIQIRRQKGVLQVRWFKRAYLTITDVSEFFQTSFLNTLTKWDIGTPEQREEIRVNKDRRAYFEYGFDQQTFDYNKLECDLLAELMEEFRKTCFESGLYPDMWTGPGRLAEALFVLEGVPQRSELNIPAIIEELGDYAYYGGRSEGFQFGEIDNILSLDIASAYPHAYTKLPCLMKEHGKWEEVSFAEVQAGNLEHTMVVGKFQVKDYIGAKHPRICGLPMRDKTGGICFPTHANGCWWYPEVRECLKFYEKERIQHKIQIDTCFTWRQSCNHLPGQFTDRWYRKRLALGKSTRGIPTKLCLNSLYGKAAQRVGAAKWANVVWAGLLTSYTRARLLEVATTLGSRHIVSFQTDGIFIHNTKEVQNRLEGLPIWNGTPGEPDLGTWELESYNHLFMIQSGVYSITKVNEDGTEIVVNKTRGMRPKEFEDGLPEIRKAWWDHSWFGEFTLPGRTAFVTVQLGLLWNKGNTIGCWMEQSKRLSFFSNCDKREIFEPTGEYTVSGKTYAPGKMHTILRQRKYGQHPLYPERYKKITDEHKDLQGMLFTIPYSRKLTEEWNQKHRENSENWQYITPDEPYKLDPDLSIP